MPKTATFLQANDDQYGWPYYSNLAGAPTGNVWYVSSVNGDAGNTGLTPDSAFATVAQANSAAVANNGDLVLVDALHSETLTAAAGSAVSKAGLRVVGCSVGRTRPVFLYTTSTAASFDVTAANVSVENFVFSPVGVDAVVAAVNVSAADVHFRNCEWNLADSTNQAVLGLLTTAAADRLYVKDCFFHGSANAGTTAALRIVGTDSSRVEGCDFIGDYSAGVGAISNITTAATNLIVKDVNIYNRTATSTKALVFDASTTGMLVRVNAQILSGTAPFTAAAMAWLNCLYSATIGASTTAP